MTRLKTMIHPLLAGLLLLLMTTAAVEGKPQRRGNGTPKKGLQLTGLKEHTGAMPYFKNYGADAFNRKPQNWTVLRDPRGVIYVGNQGGCFEYDGVSWRFIPIANWTVRSMALDDKGTVYIGGTNELGRLEPTENGSLQFHSLKKHLKDHQKDFAAVWNCHAAPEGIYFETSRFLFRLETKGDSPNIKAWEPGFTFHNSFLCRGRLYVHNRSVGLLEVRDNRLQPAPAGQFFINKKLFVMVPFDDAGQTLLVGTWDGFYLYRRQTPRPFATEADQYLAANQLYHGIRLRNGDFALATLKGGLVIIDPRGALKHIFTRETGLQNENVKRVFQDNTGIIWLALENGLTKIEYASPFRLYGEAAGLEGIVLSAVRHKGVLYAGTTSGLYALTPGPRFETVAGGLVNCRSLLSTRETLMAAAADGLWTVDPNAPSAAPRKIAEDSTHVLCRSRNDANRIWAGTADGLRSFRRTASPSPNIAPIWQPEHSFASITTPVRTIVEEPDGSLWLGTLTQGVLKVDFSNRSAFPVVNRYDTAHRLPPEEVHVFYAAGHTVFATADGLYRFDPRLQVFVPDHLFGPPFAGPGAGVFRIAPAGNREIYFHSQFANYRATKGTDNAYTVDALPFMRMPEHQINVIYPDPQSQALWFGGTNGLTAYGLAPAAEENSGPHFAALIRRVRVQDDGTLIYDGYRRTRAPGGPGEPPFVLDRRQRRLRFFFAAPFLEAEARTLYQFRLEGDEPRWSPWTAETWKDYTNIRPGTYTFRVRAKNVYGGISAADGFAFTLPAPWYAAPWAYALYLAALAALIYCLLRWRLRRLLKEKQKLERLIRQRTDEIRLKNEQLESQTLELRQKSHQLQEADRTKSRFFANISHEFRTPLTLIMGPLEQLLAQPEAAAQNPAQLQTQTALMLRNTRRLLHLVNQLLDLSRFESGVMKLQAAKQDMVPLLKSIVASFESLVRQYGQDLTLRVETEATELYFDADKMEKVLVNLLSNAVKFTPPGGAVTITLRTLHPAASETSGFLEIEVADTGVGIPADQLENVFNRFYQAHPHYEHREKGTGIGLALTRELVLLHGGDIRVESVAQATETAQTGSRFILRLPMGHAHLKPEEMVPLESNDNGRPTVFIPIHHPDADAPATPLPGEHAEPAKPDVAHVAKDGHDSPRNLVLVVEDNADMRAYIRKPLEGIYDMVEAVTGTEGIEKALEIIPDLIISDVMMPGADGFELCAQLKNHRLTSHIPIILLTAKTGEENMIHGLEQGADDYLVKPFNSRVLAARIRNLIDMRRRMQEHRQVRLNLRPPENKLSAIDEAFLQELEAAVEKGFTDSDFNVEALGATLYMSRTTLYRKVLALTGETPTQYLQSFRLQRAKQLLENHFGNVTEVAFEVGFSSRAYFTKCFREKFDLLPSDIY